MTAVACAAVPAACRGTAEACATTSAATTGAASHPYGHRRASDATVARIYARLGLREVGPSMIAEPAGG